MTTQTTTPRYTIEHDREAQALFLIDSQDATCYGSAGTDQPGKCAELRLRCDSLNAQEAARVEAEADVAFCEAVSGEPAPVALGSVVQHNITGRVGRVVALDYELIPTRRGTRGVWTADIVLTDGAREHRQISTPHGCWVPLEQPADAPAVGEART